MRYVNARIEDFFRDETYRIYVSQSLRLVPQGKYMSKSYIEFAESNKNVDTRTGEEILIDIMNKADLKFG